MTADVVRELRLRFPPLAVVPALGAAVVSDEGSVFEEVSGLRRRGGNSSVEPADAWHLGSCTKLFTGMLIGRLVENGLCGWDTAVASVLRDATEADASWAKVSLEDVLIHRAGVRCNLPVRAMLRYLKDERDVVDQRYHLVRELLSEPPARKGDYAYSNLGYVLLGAVIDELTGGSYEAAMQSTVLGPLSITSAGYGAPAVIAGHRSRVQVGTFGRGLGRPKDPSDRYSDNPAVYASAGTLHMSLGDAARFASALLSREEQFLSAVTRDRVLAGACDVSTYLPRAPAANADGPTESPASAQREYYELVGSNTLWTAVMSLEPCRCRAAIVLANDGRAPVIAASVLAARELLAR